VHGHPAVGVSQLFCAFDPDELLLVSLLGGLVLLHAVVSSANAVALQRTDRNRFILGAAPFVQF
jgi:hypothetical protein